MTKKTYLQKLVFAGQFGLMSVLYCVKVIGYSWFIVSTTIFVASTAYTTMSDYKDYKTHKQLKEGTKSP